MKTRILAIVPYIGMKKILEDAAVRYPDVDLTIQVANREDALDVLHTFDLELYDIILARGGTSDIIRRNVSLPVANIEISVYDILRAIKLAENYNRSFAVIGIPVATENARLLCELLQNDVKIVTLESYEETKSALQDLRDEGFEMVICDMATTRVAYELGMNYILITSGAESINAALKHCIQQARLYHSYRTQLKHFTAALSGYREELFIFGEDRSLQFSTLQRTDSNEHYFRIIEAHLNDFLSDENYQLEERVQNQLLKCHCSHILLDNEFTLFVYLYQQDAPALIDDIGVSDFERPNSPDSEDNFYGSANLIGETRDALDQYSKTLQPLLILGEHGTGKDKAASYICSHGEYKKHRFFIIDCKNTNQKKWNYFMENPNSALNDLHITIYVKNFQDMSEALSAKFLAYIRQNDLYKRNRFIFSYELSTETDIDTTIYQHLTSYLPCLVLRIPPLRERKEDLANIATLYINQSNIELGKQVVGFESGAMELIENFDWRNNLTQFKRVISQLVVMTSGDYISQDQVRQVLKQEDQGTASPVALQPGYELINTNQSLEEITNDIVHLVLKQEDNNRTKTVERLRISRSTLWRMLQQ